MKYIYTLLLKFFIVIIGVLTAYSMYKYIVEPHILSPMCLVNSGTCIRISYWNHENSALIHMEPIGYWVWFNGKNAYVYASGILNGVKCDSDKDNNYSPAYLVDPTTGLPHSYECIDTLDDVKKFYSDKGIKKKFIYYRTDIGVLGGEGSNLPNFQNKFITKFNVYNILNLMADKNIINLVDINK